MIKISFEKKQKTFTEFSKRAITAMIIIWFVGAVFGVGVVAYQLWRGDALISLSEVLAYIGAPMTGGIIAYMIKSAMENVPKIKKGNNETEKNIS